MARRRRCPTGGGPSQAGGTAFRMELFEDLEAEVERLRAAGVTFRNDIVEGRRSGNRCSWRIRLETRWSCSNRRHDRGRALATLPRRGLGRAAGVVRVLLLSAEGQLRPAAELLAAELRPARADAEARACLAAPSSARPRRDSVTRTTPHLARGDVERLGAQPHVAAVDAGDQIDLALAPATVAGAASPDRDTAALRALAVDRQANPGALARHAQHAAFVPCRDPAAPVLPLVPLVPLVPLFRRRRQCRRRALPGPVGFPLVSIRRSSNRKPLPAVVGTAAPRLAEQQLVGGRYQVAAPACSGSLR